MYGQGNPVQGARLYLRRHDTDMSTMLAKLERHPLVDDLDIDESKITEEAPEECHESAYNVHFDIITGGSRWSLNAGYTRHERKNKNMAFFKSRITHSWVSFCYPCEMASLMRVI